MWAGQGEQPILRLKPTNTYNSVTFNRCLVFTACLSAKQSEGLGWIPTEWHFSYPGASLNEHVSNLETQEHLTSQLPTHKMYSVCVINKRTTWTVGLCVAQIILRETVDYLSHPWGICRIRCVQFAYLSNTAGTYSPLINQTTLIHLTNASILRLHQFYNTSEVRLNKEVYLWPVSSLAFPLLLRKQSSAQLVRRLHDNVIYNMLRFKHSLTHRWNSLPST